jgi:hypothetical protein
MVEIARLLDWDEFVIDNDVQLVDGAFYGHHELRQVNYSFDTPLRLAGLI